MLFPSNMLNFQYLVIHSLPNKNASQLRHVLFWRDRLIGFDVRYEVVPRLSLRMIIGTVQSPFQVLIIMIQDLLILAPWLQSYNTLIQYLTMISYFSFWFLLGFVDQFNLQPIQCRKIHSLEDLLFLKLYTKCLCS